MPVIGATSHAIWLGSIVFDGARAFENVTPGSRPTLPARGQFRTQPAPEITPQRAEDIMEIGLDGVRRFGPDAEVYIRPMLYADAGSGLLAPDPASTRFVLTVFDAPMPDGDGFSACLSPFRRPNSETAPTDAKASVSLSQFLARHHRCPPPRISEPGDVRFHGPCGRIRNRQYLDRERWCRDHTGARTIPSSTASPGSA